MTGVPSLLFTVAPCLVNAWPETPGLGMPPVLDCAGLFTWCFLVACDKFNRSPFNWILWSTKVGIWYYIELSFFAKGHLKFFSMLT